MPRRAAGSNPAPAAGSPLGLRRVACGLFPPRAWVIEPRLFLDLTLRARNSRRMTSHETRPASGLSHHQGGDDRRHRVHHPQHLGQGRRYDASRHRSEVASGLDWRSAAAGGPRRAAVAVPEEVCRHRAQEIAHAPAWRAKTPARGGFSCGSLIGSPPQRRRRARERRLHRADQPDSVDYSCSKAALSKPIWRSTGLPRSTRAGVACMVASSRRTALCNALERSISARKRSGKSLMFCSSLYSALASFTLAFSLLAWASDISPSLTARWSRSQDASCISRVVSRMLSVA